MSKKLICCMITLMVLLSYSIAVKAGTYTSDFDKYLMDNQSKDMIRAIITISDKVDIKALKASLEARRANRQEWHETVVKAFQEKATKSQSDILALLSQMQKQGRVSDYKGMWLGNLIIVTATREAYNELVARRDVEEIALDYEIKPIKDMPGDNNQLITAGIEDGLRVIHADRVWEMGFTGEGRLVSHLDSGVDGDHGALSDQWRGNDSRYSEHPEWAWYDPVTQTDFPFDALSHGTHTMGSICGADHESGDTIGVAFGAEWISAGVIDRVSINRTISDALTAFQWIVDPDGDASTVWDVPDVCSNSWGLDPGNGYDHCDDTFWEVIDAAEACGIVLLFAAGNSGESGTETIGSPADRAYSNINAFSVGAVDGWDEDLPVADWSSRGPSYCTEDGSAAIKPEIVAPGVNIRSADNIGNYLSMSGTSMACPHVAGVVALMREADPNITVEEVKQILLDTARDLGNAGDDNNYGAGIVDAYEAVRHTLANRDDWGAIAGTITDLTTGNPIEGVTISVIDGNWSTVSGSDGTYILIMPADSIFSIMVRSNLNYLPIYEQRSITASDTTTVNYVMEPGVEAIFSVSFDNGNDISYRNFYVKGSWDNDGYYDPNRSGDFLPLADNGQVPDETAGDGIFTAQILLDKDTENSYSWSVYTENYGVDSIDDAFLASGSNFDINSYEPVEIPTLVPNPSGSENSFVFSIEGDNGLSFDLDAYANGSAHNWGRSVNLTANTTYTFSLYTMHSDEVVYGIGGVGGSNYIYTPSSSGVYDFIFDDSKDSCTVELADTTNVPGNPVATSGEDGHIPLSWNLPVIDNLSAEAQYIIGYNIYRSTSSGPFAQGLKINSNAIPANSFEDWGNDDYGPIVNETTYYYQITAVNNYAGDLIETAPSSEVSATPTNHPPEAPVNLTGAVSEHYSVNLSWDANTDYDIEAYNIYRRSFNNIEYDSIGTVEHPTTTFSEQLSTDGLFSYKIKAVDAEGLESENYSNYANLAIGLIAPGKVKATTDLEFEVKLRWQMPGSIDLSTASIGVTVALLVTDDNKIDKSGIMDYLIDEGLVSDFDIIQLISPDDTLALLNLQNYDVVITMPADGIYCNSDGIGDRIADYVDLGKGVVAFNNCFNEPGSIGGRFIEEYSPLSQAELNVMNRVNLGNCDNSYPLMNGVDELSDRFSSFALAQNNANVIAYWDNGYPCVATSQDHPNIVCINAMVSTTYNIWGGDMKQLIYNAVHHVVYGSGINPDGYNIYKSNSEDGEYQLLASVAGNVNEYIDSVTVNGDSNYYKLTAVWDSDESEPSNIAEGYGLNYAPEEPTNLTGSTDNGAVILNWDFTNLIGDFDRYNIYRRLVDNEWILIDTTTNQSYIDDLSNDDGNYYYYVTAVDNGNPQLESDPSNYIASTVGILPPGSLSAASNYDSVVPLHWYDPSILPCSTITYDDGHCFVGGFFQTTSIYFAKQFVVTAPVQICSVLVHVLTEGDPGWPFPDSRHDPTIIEVWEGDGTGNPGFAIAETTVTCELGEWISVRFPAPLICNTDNFWVSWGNTTGVDAIGLDEHCDYPGYDWRYTSDLGEWCKRPASGDIMIRASVSRDGIAELLTENNPISDSANEIPIVCDLDNLLGYHIYRGTSANVPLDDTHRITDDYLTNKYYNDRDVTNGTTYYYVTKAVYNNGDNVTLSEASNEVSATPMGSGQFDIGQSYISSDAYLGDTATTAVIALTNNGGQPITYRANINLGNDAISTEFLGEYFISSRVPEQETAIFTPDSSAEYDTPDDPMVAESGGPYAYGYTWIDSDEDNGPEYNWIDISDCGEQVQIGRDPINGPFYLGFDFPYYGNTYSTFRICNYGYISFYTDIPNAHNRTLPDAEFYPLDLVAAFWGITELFDMEYDPEVLFYAGSDSVVISFLRITDPSLHLMNYQIILTSTGTITFQYADMGGADGSEATVGMQKLGGTSGLTISHNSAYIHNNMAITIQPWLRAYPLAGTIPAGGSATMNIVLDPSLLIEADYFGMLTFAANDLTHDLNPIELPVFYSVQEYIGIDDNPSLALPEAFSLDQNYPNPFNAKTEIKYALPVDSDVKLEIYNVLGQNVTTLVDKNQSAGYHSLIWDGTNESGQVVSSGLYLYRLTANDKSFLKKMILLK